MGSAEDLLFELYETMYRIRTVDGRIRDAITKGRVTCFLYSPAGQEAIAAGAARALRPDDYWVGTYRCLHDAIAKGVPLVPLLAEMMGRVDGTGRGRGGPMHIADPDCGLIQTTGIVGSGLPIADGLAVTAKLAGSDRVTVCSFGDGATNTGSFHEAVNLAAVWELPVIFLCQNNQYAEMTPSRHSYRSESLAERGRSYGIAAEQVDGFDPVAVYEATTRAVERARAADGPTLLECVAYRYGGHYFGDPMEYIRKAEMEEMLERDPVPAMRRRVLEVGADAAAVEALEARVAAELEAAFEAALASELAGVDEVGTDVYASAGAGGR